MKTRETINATAHQHGFTLERTDPIPEIEGNAHVMKHRASGARLLYLENDDANKAFSISFKTPANDDTGVFHILEHSVLCGSQKFPVKEPFVNLLKSSMQTFLNAMTFPDKTMYPVASTNEQDLLNLMDVYLDAVFHPAIYEKPTIFEQEGWHYELVESDSTASEGDVKANEGDTGETGGEESVASTHEDAINAHTPQLVYNGVVFNEMKGALSDPDSVIYDALSAALFPHTTYRFESGGMPQSIPDLTYEGFLDAHARHYRPDNSYLTLYGNLDLDTFLGFLDERYLTPLADVSRPPLNVNPLELQEPVITEGVVKTMPTAPENATCALGFVIGHARERERIIAVDILLDAIMGSNEAPLKRALLDADLAADATAFVADAMLQPFAVFQLRGLTSGKAPQLKQVVMREAKRLADGALDHELLEASLSHAEFVMREGNFGYADGVLYAISSLSSWLYDDELATAYLRYDDIFATLREKIATGYFEQLLRELVLESNHFAEVELVPVSGKESEREGEDAGLAARLAKKAAEMTPADFAAVEAAVRTLREAQEAPDAPQDLAKLPQLALSDIGEAPAEPAYQLDESQPVRMLRHDAQKHGIAYAYRYFDLSCVRFEDLPYVTVLAMALGKLGTAHHSAAQLDTLIQGKLGNFAAFAEVHERLDNREAAHPKLVVSASSLDANVEHLASLVREIIMETDFSDRGKLRDILLQKKIAMEQGFASAGHSAAMARLASYYLPAAVAREQLGGVDFYAFLKGLVEHWDERADALTTKVAALAQLIFTDENCLISWSGSDGALARFWGAGAAIGIGSDSAAASDASPEPPLVMPCPVVRNEAFVVASDVTYTATGFDRRLLDAASTYNGSWLVASRALSFDYLWNEVRVKGGAYGCGFQAARMGGLRFYSYRDPRIDETLARFASAGTWLAGFDPTNAEMDGYVVSTTASLDAPQKTRELIRRQDGQFFAGITPEMRLHTRDEVLAATPESIRELDKLVTAAAAQNAVCTFGNRNIIQDATQDFRIVDLLG